MRQSDRGFSGNAPIPDSWLGPAAMMFDKEMGQRMGNAQYSNASQVVSMLAHYQDGIESGYAYDDDQRRAYLEEMGSKVRHE